MLESGSNGFYQFVTDGTPGVYTMNVVLPTMYEWSTTCLAQSGAFDPTGLPNPVVLGNGEMGTSGFITSNACTQFYLQFDLAPDDPIIINHNFPLMRRQLPVPTLSEWGLFVFAVLLGATSVLFLLRRKRAP